MVNFWFTADQHFNHENIIIYCNRPFKSVEHMDRELIRRWNEKVKPGKDVVIHLGDICFRKRREGILKDYDYYVNQLNGKIILFKGNHDSKNEVRSILTEGVIHYGGIDWYMKHEPHNTFKYNLCGHIHEKWRVRRQGPHVCVNVGVDVWDFYPVSIQEIMRAIQEYDKDGEG